MRTDRRTKTFPVLLLASLSFVAASPAQPAGAAAGGTGADTFWGANYFPNVPLTTHEGKPVRFFDDLIKGKVVVINFMFTSCPDVCPLETAQLREVQEILGDRVGRDVFMYSISIDPETDTPEVLRNYMERFEVGPGWTFLTGKEDDITLLRRKLGLLGEREPTDNLATHNLNLVIGNQATGQWMKAAPFENPHILATRVGSWLHNWKAPSGKKRDYADAPELRSISKGESLFRTRCAACHTIGGKADPAMAKKPVGPDLAGITGKRDRAWLFRWLREPDKMLAAKDPIAVALFAEYDNVAMPNLRLSDTDIQALLVYIDEETRIRRGSPPRP